MVPSSPVSELSEDSRGDELDELMDSPLSTPPAVAILEKAKLRKITSSQYITHTHYRAVDVVIPRTRRIGGGPPPKLQGQGERYLFGQLASSLLLTEV